VLRKERHAAEQHEDGEPRRFDAALGHLAAANAAL
jgi:hypothetical protein